MKYRVWALGGVGRPMVRFDVHSPEEGKAVMERLAKGYEMSRDDMPGNMGLEHCVLGAWCDWYDDDGYDVFGNEGPGRVGP